MKKIECIIMDWAGTAVDYGCFAPVAAFMKAFAEKGLSIDVKQTRKPMGLPKIQHIRELLTMPEVNEQFTSRYQRSWAEEDVVELNRLFEEYLFASLEEYTDPIPGVIPTLEKLRTEGLKIGSTTGYTREMMDVVLPAALAKGYCVDYCDIKEGVNAKVWSVGVILGSNEMGLTEEETDNLTADELEDRMVEVRNRMLEAGASYVIRNIEELPALIQTINLKMNTL